MIITFIIYIHICCCSDITRYLHDCMMKNLTIHLVDYIYFISAINKNYKASIVGCRDNDVVIITNVYLELVDCER